MSREAAAAEVAAPKAASMAAPAETAGMTTPAALGPQRYGQDQGKRRYGHPTAHTTMIISPHGTPRTFKIFRCAYRTYIRQI